MLLTEWSPRLQTQDYMKKKVVNSRVREQESTGRNVMPHSSSVMEKSIAAIHKSISLHQLNIKSAKMQLKCVKCHNRHK